MPWITPTGDYESGTGSDWGNDEYAYDDDLATYAITYVEKQSWSKFLHLIISEIQCDRVRVWPARTAAAGPLILDVDIYDGSSWIDLHEGAYTRNAWNEFTFTQRAVTEMRMRFYNSSTIFTYDGWIKEADFGEVEGLAPGLRLDVCI